MEKNKELEVFDIQKGLLKEVRFYLLGSDVLSRIQLLSFHFQDLLAVEVDIFWRRVVRRCVDMILEDKIFGENQSDTICI